MVRNIDNVIVDINVSEEIRKSLASHEEKKHFFVRIATTYKVWVNPQQYRQVRLKMTGQDKLSLAETRIRELEEELANK